MTNGSENKGEIAKQNFKNGLNCCQAVLLAFQEELGLTEETLLKLGSSFGGGMGRLREVCGTVSGMFMVTGLLKSTDKNTDYQRVQKLAKQFEAENGSIVCRELLKGMGEKPTSALPAEDRTENYYKKRACADLCAFAAELTQKELSEENAKP